MNIINFKKLDLVEGGIVAIMILLIIMSIYFFYVFIFFTFKYNEVNPIVPLSLCILSTSLIFASNYFVTQRQQKRK